MVCMKLVEGVNLKSSHYKEKKKAFFSLFFLSYLYEMMDVSITSCGNNFAIYVSQIIVLYTLNLYSAIGQLYQNKTRGDSMHIFILVVVIN